MFISGDFFGVIFLKSSRSPADFLILSFWLLITVVVVLSFSQGFADVFSSLSGFCELLLAIFVGKKPYNLQTGDSQGEYFLRGLVIFSFTKRP